jgi:hypothetical protein
LQALEADLAKGTPMADALKPRQLPELYKRMILVGVKSGDLPGALTMLADYFQRQNNVWTRLKSMMTYPLIVMFVAFLMSWSGKGASPPAAENFPKWPLPAAYFRRCLSGRLPNPARTWHLVFSAPPNFIKPVPCIAPNCCFTRRCLVRSWRWQP